MLSQLCVSSTLFLISDPRDGMLPHKYHLLLCASCFCVTFDSSTCLNMRHLWLLPRRKVVFLPATPLPSWSFPNLLESQHNCHSGFTQPRLLFATGITHWIPSVPPRVIPLAIQSCNVIRQLAPYFLNLEFKKFAAAGINLMILLFLNKSLLLMSFASFF